jgi:WD40 repeat protein
MATASMVLAVAMSPDGKQVACGAKDGTVRLYDLQTRQETRRLGGHASWVTGVAYSPDGTRLASCSGGMDERGRPLPGAVLVWNAAEEKPFFTYRDEGSIDGLAFSPDGKRLVTAGREVQLWDLQTGNRSQLLRGHDGQVHGAAWSRDGSLIATAGQDRTVRLWEVETGALLATLTGHAQRVSAVAFSPDGKWLASAGGELRNPGEVRVWDVESRNLYRLLEGHTDRVAGVCFSPDGKRLASAGADQAIRLWDVATGQEVLSLRGHTCAVFSRDGQKLAGSDRGGFDERGRMMPGVVKVWEAPSEPEKR